MPIWSSFGTFLLMYGSIRYCTFFRREEPIKSGQYVVVYLLFNITYTSRGEEVGVILITIIIIIIMQQ